MSRIGVETQKWTKSHQPMPRFVLQKSKSSKKRKKKKTRKISRACNSSSICALNLLTMRFADLIQHVTYPWFHERWTSEPQKNMVFHMAPLISSRFITVESRFAIHVPLLRVGKTSAIRLKMKTISWCFCGRIMGIANLDFRSQDLKSLLPTHRRSILIIWLVVSNIFYFHPYLGKWSNLTNIFQMGWNHHLVYCKYHPPPRHLTFIYRIPKISKYPS